MATQIKLRRDTAANWLLEDPVLGQGEPGFETTSGKLKIGDGTSLWSALDYIVAEPDGSIDLGAVDKHVLPATDNTYDLGSPAKRWKHGYFATGSLYVGDIKLSNSSGTLVVQQVTNAGEITEAPVANPGVVTTDRIINGIHEFSINASGVLQLNGAPYLGGDTVLPTNTLGYLYNDGTGTLTWASGAGGGGGGATDRLVNGVNEIVLDANGVLTNLGTWTKITMTDISSGVGSQVVWTSTEDFISGAKLTIQVEANEPDGLVGWDTQMCESIVAVRGHQSTSIPVISVYGVTHTSTAPLMTFTVDRNPVTNLIEITGTRTGTATTAGSASLRIYSVETGTMD
jgi:hypothetical protein